jgi:hypothetical protein
MSKTDLGLSKKNRTKKHSIVQCVRQQGQRMRGYCSGDARARRARHKGRRERSKKVTIERARRGMGAER